MTTSKKLSDDLWTPRSAEETRAIYDDWAEHYDDDLVKAGYATPARLARALAEALPDRTAPVLDFGCGTGMSGEALRAAGIATIDGTDISPEMLNEARAKGLYRKLWQGEPGRPLPVTPGDYAAITATGVVSLGAAPPETLGLLIAALAPGGLLAFSFNDGTLADADYTAALKAALDGPMEKLSEAYGPHLPAKEMGSTVFVLRRR